MAMTIVDAARVSRAESTPTSTPTSRPHSIHWGASSDPSPLGRMRLGTKRCWAGSRASDR